MNKKQLQPINLHLGGGEPFFLPANTNKPQKNLPESTIKRSNTRTYLLRTIFTIVLISYFCFTVYIGPVLIIGTTIAIQFKCFKEIINVAFSIYPMKKLPWFQFTSWYFLISFNYFFGCETMTKYFSAFVEQYDVLKIIVQYHRFVSFCLYFSGIIWFVVHLGIKYDKEQYALFACVQLAITILGIQSYMIVRNIFTGMIWLIVPVTTVVMNDIAAFLCGKFFGKTPLIQLSPGKTWEGYLGGGYFTIIYAYIITLFLNQYEYFICPIEYKSINSTVKMFTSCGNNYEILQSHTKELYFDLYFFDVLVTFPYNSFTIHAFFIALFASVVAPFGGFFASGFKRAFGVKDFGNTIPGHGGITDRFDCQFLVATFVNVYIYSFIQSVSVDDLFERVLKLDDGQQVEVFEMLQELIITNRTLVY